MLALTALEERAQEWVLGQEPEPAMNDDTDEKLVYAGYLAAVLGHYRDRWPVCATERPIRSC